MRRTTPALGTVAAAALGLVLAGCSATPTSTGTADANATTTETATMSDSGTMSATTGAPTTATPSGSAGNVVAMGTLVNPSGAEVGQVQLSQAGSGLQMQLEASNLTPGFHGLHFHGIGKCEPNSPDPKDTTKTGDFNSSGGHLEGGGTEHPEHAGDLPVLYVGQDGTGTLTTVSDRLTADVLTDEDGSALVIHEGPDNYANIPTRYASAGADEESKKAGDAGPRVACAVMRAPGQTETATPSGATTASSSPEETATSPDQTETSAGQTTTETATPTATATSAETATMTPEQTMATTP